MATYGPPTVEEYLADLNKQLSRSKRKLKKTNSSIEAVNKSLVRLGEEIYSLADARGKVPQITYLLRNFQPQELYGTKQGDFLAQTSSVLGISSYKNEESPLELLILDTTQEASESGMSDFEKDFSAAVLEFLEFDGRNQPKYSISEDYKKLFEDGTYSLVFWDNFSGVTSNEIERRQDAVNRLSDVLPRLKVKKAQYEASIQSTQSAIDQTDKTKNIEEPVPVSPPPAAPPGSPQPLENEDKVPDEETNASTSQTRSSMGAAHIFDPAFRGPTAGKVGYYAEAPVKTERHFDPASGRVVERPVGREARDQAVSTERPKRDAREFLGRIYEQYPEIEVGRVRQIWSLLANNLTAKGDPDDSYDYAAALIDNSPNFNSGFRSGWEIGSSQALGIASGAVGAVGKALIKEGAKKLALKLGIQAAANVVLPGAGIVAGIVISKAVDMGIAAWNKIKKYLGAGAAYLYLRFVQAFGPAIDFIYNFIGLGKAGFATTATSTAGVTTGSAPTLSTAAAPATSGLAGAIGNLWNSFMGAESSSLVTGWGGVNLGGISVSGTGTVFASLIGGTFVMTVLSGGVDAALSTEASVNENPPEAPLFQVVKTPSVTTLSNNAGLQPVRYTIRVTPNSGTTITMVEDEGKVYTSAGTETVMPKHSLDTANPTDSLSVDTNKYTDSTLINTVTVTATGADGKVQQRTAVAIVTIGSPKNEPPYGFPLGANASITTLDNEMLKIGTEPPYAHCGEVYGTADCPPGGLDIAATGDVHSTVNGYVAFAGTNSRIGGYVGIVSGPYYVAFIHLKTPSIAVGTPVKRNDVVGQVYLGGEPKPTRWEGAHLHYQVLAGGSNMFFADSKNAGPCKDTSGKRTVAIEPTALTKNSTVTYDPRVCD